MHPNQEHQIFGFHSPRQMYTVLMCRPNVQVSNVLLNCTGPSCTAQIYTSPSAVPVPHRHRAPHSSVSSFFDNCRTTHTVFQALKSRKKKESAQRECRCPVLPQKMPQARSNLPLTSQRLTVSAARHASYLGIVDIAFAFSLCSHAPTFPETQPMSPD